jgi:SAM-dependent methyltransferase
VAKLLKDIIVLPEEDGWWLVLNVFARTNLLVESKVIDFLSQVSARSLSDVSTRFVKDRFHVREVQYFSNADGLLADPTGFRRNRKQWGKDEALTVSALVERLKEKFIIVENAEEYRKRFAVKNSLLDQKHFGNFHQQLGKELLINRRIDPNDWWLKQKFAKNLRDVQKNLYGAVQANFLKAYFPKRFKKNDTVVDLGCGIGFYTNQMAQYAGSVMGVDPNEKFIRIAEKHAPRNVRYHIAAIGKKDGLDSVPDRSADYVFMSDALLFYFTPPDPREKNDINILFNDIKRILKPGGTFISVEPHYIFWLSAWLGEEDNPFTILTEYCKKQYKVTATMSGLIQKFTKAGFAVTCMEEMTPAEYLKSTDKRAYFFGKQFPLWQLFELKVL